MHALKMCGNGIELNPRARTKRIGDAIVGFCFRHSPAQMFERPRTVAGHLLNNNQKTAAIDPRQMMRGILMPTNRRI